MPPFGIRLQLAAGSLVTVALFAANLGVHTWAGGRREDALARLRHAADRRADVMGVQRDLADRWREVDALQYVPLAPDQRHALAERLAALGTRVGQLVHDAPDQERTIASAFLTESAPLLRAWARRYNEAPPAGMSLPDPAQATERLVALRTWNERAAALAVDELTRVSALTDRISVAIFVLTLGAISIALLILWRTLSHGVDLLADGATRLGHGELDHRIVLGRRDELGHLAAAFNLMAASIEHAQAEAETARHLAERASGAKSRFLTSITHDFRTPLTAILGYAELIRDEAMQRDLPGVVADTVHIDAAGHHLLALINELLDLAKAASGRLPLRIDTFGVPGVIDDVVAAVVVLAGKGGNHLEIRVDSEIGTMTSDAMKVRQTLFNLVGNAVKFTTDGTIVLQAERTQRDGSDWVRFVVSDTGIGIPDDRLDRVFDEFEQADASVARAYGGSGLGLAITRRFCRLMGGEVTVSSRVGTGTTFVVELPARLSPHAADATGVLALPTSTANRADDSQELAG